MGGGLAFIEGAGGSLTQCEIVSGRAGRGGGVYCQGAEPRFELCRLVGNRAEGTAPDGLGGGAYVEAAEGDAVPSFVECTLQGNRASVDGGGAYLKLDGRWDSIEFAECTFIENFATARGGALASAAPGSVHLAACDIRLNFAQEGGAISGSGGASIRAADSDFVYNEAWLHGGGLHLQDADATLVGSRFRANSAGGAGSRTAHYGGVAAVFGGRLTMESCQCTANYADTHGGAVYSSGGYGLETLACLFEGNQVGTDGGALFLAGGTQHSLHSTIFRLNEAGDDGGAIVVRDVTQLTASWCQFDRNSADDDGGAIYAYDRVTLGLRNSTFSLNRAPDGGAVNLNNQCAATVDNSIFAFSEVGAAFHCPGGSTAVLACCDVFGNAGGDWVGCLLGQDAGAGNISLDPLFCDKEQGDLSVGGASHAPPRTTPSAGRSARRRSAAREGSRLSAASPATARESRRRS
ncbi:MAG: hypothetical protein FJY75_14440, partial [Candidatus Eisenbacteria bacterium]|nr:hypothetical protein [Candidatus Eisenbacteria bacterium]